MENCFGIYVTFRRWNQRKWRTEASTTHQGPGAPWCIVPSSNIGSSPSSGARKIIYGENHVKIIAQSELWILVNLRNHEGPDLGM